MNILRIWVVLLLAVSGGSFAQSVTPAATNPNSDAEAVALAKKVQAALSSAQVSDLLINAEAASTAGSTKTSGTATLSAKGLLESRIEVAAGAASRSEIRNDNNGPDGQWIGLDGARHSMSMDNCWGPAAWFAPYALAQSMSGANVVLHYVGQEKRNGLSVEHVQLHRSNTAADPTLKGALETFSAVEVFLDPSTFLPVALAFNVHPDDNAGLNIPVEIRFSDYRSIGATVVPFHIQRFVQGVLNLDLTVTSASANTGLTDGSFALQ